MNIYTKEGWLNFDLIMGKGYPFIFIWGGRGVGKTYGIMKYLHEYKKHFCYIRTTQTQILECSKDSKNPFKKYNFDNEVDYKIKGGNILLNGEVVGQAQGLTTSANIRSIDGSDITVMFYEEFIPKKGEREYSDSADLLKDLYETLNRNRELQGEKPIQCICASNSNYLVNPVFVGLGLIKYVEKMAKQKLEVLEIPQRGILLINVINSPISEKKAETALYKLGGGIGSYEDMALNNSFVDFNNEGIKKFPLTEFKPIVTIGEITIYKHKSKGFYYVSFHKMGTCPTYSTDRLGRTQYKMRYGSTWWAMLANNMYFESIFARELYINIHSKT